VTNRQIYQALARMAGHKCYDGKKFLVSKRVGGDHLESVQNQMLVLMQKVSYQRCLADFSRVIMERQVEPVLAQNMAQNAQFYQSVTASPTLTEGIIAPWTPFQVEGNPRPF
jgi:hypothetical protein